MEEIWEKIKGTNGHYEVSNTGKVRSTNYRKSGTVKELKLTKDGKGYLRTTLTLNGNYKTIKVHREVAKAFIPNPLNKPQVNHKDGNKQNNHVDNLEWMTNVENAHHAMETGLWGNVLEASKRANKKRERPIEAVKISTGEKVFFPTMREAERLLNTKHINAVIRGERKQSKGYTFSYADKGVMP